MNSITGILCGTIISKAICYSLGLPDPILIQINGTVGTLLVLTGGVLGGIIGYFK